MRWGGGGSYRVSQRSVLGGVGFLRLVGGVGFLRPVGGGGGSRPFHGNIRVIVVGVNLFLALSCGFFVVESVHF